MRSTFVRSLLVVSAIFIAVFSAEFVFEWVRLGKPGVAEMSWAGNNNAKLVDLLSPMARAYNNILAMLLATIGLAIPLTANMHTPKLIDMFLRDRLNRAMLSFMALAAANVLLVAYLIGPEFAPMWAFRVAVFGALAGWALVIPYFLYVVRFLDPSNILTRLKDDVTAVVEQAAAGRIGLDEARQTVHERLHQIGTIVLKSLDRADRGVALEGVWTLKRLLDHHGERKARMPAGWFVVDRGDFVGLSAEAIEVLNEERTWFEMKALAQLFLGYQHALAKTSDVISSISDANRVVAVSAGRRGDLNALELSVRYFNNFLREAIKRKDTHAIYDVFYQYRLLARDLPERSELLGEIGRYFRYYGELAQANGMGFISQLAAFDLGYMVRRAFEASSPAAPNLLCEVLAIPHEGKLLVVKAKVILGGFFLERSLVTEADLVRKNLQDVPNGLLTLAERDLLAADRVFFEVTDRQVNFEYLPTERRDHVRAFVASLDTDGERAASA
ncbi:MAG: DUF2254 domain-containing protein [Deltaproteobacteria bacterium]|nr:DUF2254 domain-containing protein [Deltaproteobacteria bacterium]